MRLFRNATTKEFLAACRNESIPYFSLVDAPDVEIVDLPDTGLDEFNDTWSLAADGLEVETFHVHDQRPSSAKGADEFEVEFDLPSEARPNIVIRGKALDQRGPHGGIR